ncbi:S41 family peptidase [uncultured Aquimarina sp.]|uniref:S41 family peptidase n=1 Tax=uncultured Aquimarina sp. TaxID=575652 RepID=UPI00263182EA|nr:S41 family peptidase [uncultured Aquimarina sp.]
MKRIKEFLILLLLLIIAPGATYSQKTLSKTEKDDVLERIKVLIDSNYVFIDKIKYINNSLDSLKLTNKYNKTKEYKDFAEVLTEGLVGITNDLHFKVQYNPKLIKSRRERLRKQAELENEQKVENDEEEIDWNLWYAKKENFGFEKVEILEGNIGYIKLNFWENLEWVKPTIDATMRFVTNTDALIIDLTENQGGYSPTDSYLGSYFFNEEPTLWMSSYNRPTGETSTKFTFQKIEGERFLNKPIYILVGEKTFSLAEQFAYAMKHFEKAKIVGQNSAGAAHAINFLDLNDKYAIQLPISYSIHPVTKTDWEGVGVVPDINASKSEALKVAYLNALDKLIESAKKAKLKTLLKRYDKIKTEINNR